MSDTPKFEVIDRRKAKAAQEEKETHRDAHLPEAPAATKASPEEGASPAAGSLASSGPADPAWPACRCAPVSAGPAAEVAAWSRSRGGDSALSSEPASGSAPGVTPLIRAPSAYPHRVFRTTTPPTGRPNGARMRTWTARANPQRRRHPPEFSAIAAPPERQPAQPRPSDNPAIAHGNLIWPDDDRNPDRSAND